MPLSARAVVLAVVMIALCGAGACAGGILGKRYEYEEDLYLALDGTATVVVNASVPALVALRGIDLDLATTTRLDVDKIREAYSSPVAQVTRVSPPWRRGGRRFVQIRLDVKDESGQVTNWSCELGSPNLLMRNGWRRDTLKPGDSIVVNGSAAKDGSKMANARTVRMLTQTVEPSPGVR